MTYIEPPSPRLWTDRVRWFDERLRKAADDNPLHVGSQTEAVLAELRRVFAAGAWVAAVVLAQTAIDSEVSERVEQAVGDGLYLNEVRFGRDYVWLRDRRNAYLHNEGPLPAVTARDLALDQPRLEKEARRAVELMADALAGRA
ncbi:hypothetical protein GCM10017083_42720 [Thalassobaculum fulvum]|jgi:hypothetical protein|uniref:Nucleotidyltransferase n=1 Tax=Thalassobaculum fulvum TaxID=1633335 RepID=A0A918XVE5_9PROT|nr:hypothetical protein [Thalassobaculum fulvum]GHD58961.1 hypothetical protein GCM10017083_42720 [Thalassobaculum fulvum]